MPVEAVHINYMAYVHVFRDRADSAVLAFTQAVRKLESHSSLCRKFFAIPLQSAKSLLKKCQTIQTGLYSENPDFQSLVPLSEAIHLEQKNIFNYIGAIIDGKLRIAGFTAKLMFITHIEWKKITNENRYHSRFCASESDRHYGHNSFMEDIFSIPPVWILRTYITQEENEGIAIDLRYPDMNLLVINSRRESYPEHPFIHEKSRMNSNYASPELSDEEGYPDEDVDQDTVYVPVELGEYKEFEEMCEMEEGVQQAE